VPHTQKSLSGIAVTEQCVALYTELKSKSCYRYLTFKIDGAGGRVRAHARRGGCRTLGSHAPRVLPALTPATSRLLRQVIADQMAPTSATFASFADSLPEHDCRYGGALRCVGIRHQCRARIAIAPELLTRPSTVQCMTSTT